MIDMYLMNKSLEESISQSRTILFHTQSVQIMKSRWLMAHGLVYREMSICFAYSHVFQYLLASIVMPFQYSPQNAHNILLTLVIYR